MHLFGRSSSSNPAAASPRLVAMSTRRRLLPKWFNFVLPLTLLFSFGGIAYTFKWNSDRQKNNGVCIDCERQREMMEEVYFNKKNEGAHKGYRL
ncbi:hypothetical protein ABL78_1490 [Leptomonas seymouri]|uniref:Uncharacterized protein n=1 Tax=Leptomonas seymouri TaxID=5684 RepID=A0A0N1PEX4_LEPSE|nr:hypothetical protein ABL78_1490 [Leptomonas seymouri]|eukprot:KPI89364.1 hypothetical protein ABL78_1490 [Leptomonas seymouri]